jgi:hypothetical protein
MEPFGVLLGNEVGGKVARSELLIAHNISQEWNVVLDASNNILYNRERERESESESVLATH